MRPSSTLLRGIGEMDRGRNSPSGLQAAATNPTVVGLNRTKDEVPTTPRAEGGYLRIEWRTIEVSGQGFVGEPAKARSEHLPVNRMPVRVAKMRQKKELETLYDSN